MEALGRSTIEAMLAGNIVIGADTGGTKELIGLEEKEDICMSKVIMKIWHLFWKKS